MQWIFLSPHLDDAVFSCGGLIAERVAGGDSVEIWTACAGDPPDEPLTPFANELHQRWGTSRGTIMVRRAEDNAASQVLGAARRHFSIPDCIYRRDPVTGEPLIAANDDLFRPLPESQAGLVVELRMQLNAGLPVGSQLVAPLTLGNHIDHQLVRRAAEGLNRPLWFYADYPYAVEEAAQALPILSPTVPVLSQSISPAGLRAWQAAIAKYKSQISSFWDSLDEMETAIHSYWSVGGGSNLWGNRADNR